MTGTRKVGIAGSFGPRYGTVARKRYVEIVSRMRLHHECPRCSIKAVRRLSVGIWLCRRCGLKFAGGAYAPTTKLGEIAKRATRGAAAVTATQEETVTPEEMLRNESTKAASEEKAKGLTKGRRRTQGTEKETA